jgi:hypothetical protein
MTLYDEMKKKVADIKKDSEKKMFDVITTYAEKANPYKQGDIIEDHYQVGKIKQINYAISVYSGSFQITYVCERLKKNLEPFKSGEMCTIYFANIKKQHNV